ncbi:MAG: DUF2996 domain-containing protein, partial [Leptolyngbya sp. SIO1D8]|nr:DUF2996 domain-containing protein [Leptolyngbya sp. SIO1D8]
MAEEKSAQPSKKAPTSKVASPAKGAGAGRSKKEKPPAVENKPFGEFIEQHFLATLEAALKKAGLEGVVLQFQKAQLAVKGASPSDLYWQVKGTWPMGGKRQFNIVFTKEDIKSPKFFY